MTMPAADMFHRFDADHRADDRRREVTLSADTILIVRQMAGIRMRVCVPTAMYKGLVLARPAADATGTFAIVLSHADPELCVVVDKAGSLDALRARLDAWAAFFDTDVLPARATGAAQSRRRSAPTRTRRPSFFARRKPGTLPSQPMVLRTEAEIDCCQ